MAWIRTAQGELPSYGNSSSNTTWIEYDNGSWLWNGSNWSVDVRMAITNRATGKTWDDYNRKAASVWNGNGMYIGENTTIIPYQTKNGNTYYSSIVRMYGQNGSREVLMNTTVFNTGSSSGWSNHNGSIVLYGTTGQVAPAAPTISNFSVLSITRDSFIISFTPNIGSGASLNLRQYSINGGTTWINVGANSFTVGSLTPNTNYNVRVRIGDNYGRTVTSGSIIALTLGNPPLLSDVGADTIEHFKAVMKFTAQYDGAAVLKEYKWEYGKYDIDENVIYNSNVLEGLQENTTYYYRLTVTDNFNRTTTQTGEFLTLDATDPIINDVIQTSVTPFEMTIRCVAQPGEAGSYITGYEFNFRGHYDQGWTPISENDSYTFTDLDPEFQYAVRARVRDNLGQIVLSEEYYFSTLSDGIGELIQSDGSSEKCDAYIIDEYGNMNKISKDDLHIMNE